MSLEEIRTIIQEEHDVLIKAMVDIANAQLRCNTKGGKVVLRTEKELKEIKKRE